MWPNTVSKFLCPIHHYFFLSIYAWTPVFCKIQGQPLKGLFVHLAKVCAVAMVFQKFQSLDSFIISHYKTKKKSLLSTLLFAVLKSF